MLSRLFTAPARIQMLRNSPAAASLENFGQTLVEAGYVTIVARRYLRAAEHLVYWSHRRGMSVRDLNEQSLSEFRRHLNGFRCSNYAHSKRREIVHGARLFLGYLQDGKVRYLRSVKPRHDPALLLAFCEWMRRQRGSSERTLCCYSIHIRELLRRLGEEPSRFDARRLRAFVLAKSRSSGEAAVSQCVKALRMFLRFLIMQGECAVGLDGAIPAVIKWRLASLPRYLLPKDVERLIASCDQDSVLGLRDRAILLLLARLGLRVGDIVHLRLGDIDWKNASILVCGKTRRQARLPLTQEVGQAIVAYLQKGRPRVDTDRLFICRAPFRPFGSGCAVSVLVARAFRRAGVVRPCRGAAHLLRHSLATSMLRQGASLENIAAILRHRSIETTQIYAKVDIPSLRQIAQPWPGV